MALVHQLERRELIARSRSHDDARQIGLTSSDAGDTKLAKACQAIAHHETWLRARFSEKEAAMLSVLLGRIFAD